MRYKHVLSIRYYLFDYFNRYKNNAHNKLVIVHIEYTIKMIVVKITLN